MEAMTAGDAHDQIVSDAAYRSERAWPAIAFSTAVVWPSQGLAVVVPELTES